MLMQSQKGLHPKPYKPQTEVMRAMVAGLSVCLGFRASGIVSAVVPFVVCQFCKLGGS